MAGIKIYTWFCLLILMAAPAGSQPLGKLLSPSPSDTVKNGELFILVELDPALDIDRNTVQFRLDGDEMSMLVQVTDNRASVLITQSLKPGQHTFDMIGRGVGKVYYEVKGDFFILNSKAFNEQAALSEDAENKKQKTSFGGNLNAEAMGTRLSGPGQELRQEPPFTQNVAFEGKVIREKFQIPMKFFVTNLNYPGVQSRNRYSIGFRSKYFDSDLGDVYPVFDRFSLNGVQTRGTRAELKFRSISLTLVHGSIANAREGSSEKYNIKQGIPPSTLQEDSTYYIYGTYRRRLNAAKFAISSFDRQSTFYISMVQATDIANSIEIGGTPAQNLVGSSGMDFKTKNDKLHLQAGVAMSLTTNDISAGALSKDEIDEYYKTDIPFDPLSYSGLIAINTTTTPILIQKRSSMSWFVQSVLNLKHQRIEARYESVGAAYQSFANPFFLSDRRVISLSDRFFFWKRRINFSLQANTYKSNLSEISLLTNETHQLTGRLSLRPHVKLPFLFGNYSYYIRTAKNMKTAETASEYHLNNLVAGANYIFKTGKQSHTILFTYNLVENNNQLTASLLQQTEVVSFGLTELFPFRLSLNVQLQQITTRNDTLIFNDQSAISGFVTYYTKSKNWNLTGSFTTSKVKQTFFTPESLRLRNAIGIQRQVMKGMRVGLEGGYADFSEPTSEARAYNELFLTGRLNYRFLH
ncbi:MAG: hypothetical protein WD077_07190 [Bacteroidia bacterium]